MPTDTTEAALEACIERFFTGDISTPTSKDGKVQEDPAAYQAGKGVGYLRGQSSDFNAEFALDEAKFWQFLEAIEAGHPPKAVSRNVTPCTQRMTFSHMIIHSQ